MSSIEYFIEPIFKIEFFKIKCIDFAKKKQLIETVLKQYPEAPLENFYTNRNRANFLDDFQKIFKDEISLVNKKYNRKIHLYNLWSVSYKKGNYHVPHNHGSKGYCGILYLNMKEKSPLTTYIQPWQTEMDTTKLYKPKVVEGDIMIVPQFIYHYTEQNTINFNKRIISFDFI